MPSSDGAPAAAELFWFGWWVWRTVFPPRMGAALAVNDEGEVAGSLDEPGLEAAMVPASRELLDGGDGPSLSRFGDLEVLLAPADWTVLLHLADALRRGRDVALAAQVRGPAVGAAMLVGGHGRLGGSLGDDRLDTIASPDALGALALRRTTTHHYGLHGQRRGRDVAVFVESFNRPARLVVLGASGLTAAMVRVGSAAGFRVSVCDPRPDFATGERYPEAAAVECLPLDAYVRSLVQLGPADAVCVMTGDPVQEVPALVASLATRIGYVGAFGIGGTSASRDAALRSAGVGAQELTRISGSPSGSWSPGETAVAICADIVARRRAGPAPPLPSFR